MFRLFLMVIRNLLIVPWAYFKLRRYARHPDAYSDQERYGFIRFLIQRALKKGNIDLKVYGQENLPEENGFMLYSNHQGKFDPMPIIASCGRPIRAVMKKELYANHFLRLLIDASRSLLMDRGNIRQSVKVIREVVENVNTGHNVVIFPEGETSKSNRLMDFHSGSFRCAIETHCPVVPIALVDSFRPFDEKGFKKRRVQIHYLTPITWEEYRELSSSGLAGLVKERIRQAIDSSLSAAVCP